MSNRNFKTVYFCSLPGTVVGTLWPGVEFVCFLFFFHVFFLLTLNDDVTKATCETPAVGNCVLFNLKLFITRKHLSAVFNKNLSLYINERCGAMECNLSELYTYSSSVSYIYFWAKTHKKSMNPSLLRYGLNRRRDLILYILT